MNNIIDKKLYEEVKNDINKIYKKNSAYRSGAYIKEYKKRGGRFLDEKPKNIDKTPLLRWFKEEWTDVGNDKYPVYRPQKKITTKTPLTINEVDKTNLQKQIKTKQIYKGKKNLPPFLPNI